MTQGEGSRGGKIVGHYRSGRAKYAAGAGAITAAAASSVYKKSASKLTQSTERFVALAIKKNKQADVAVFLTKAENLSFGQAGQLAKKAVVLNSNSEKLIKKAVVMSHAAKSMTKKSKFAAAIGLTLGVAAGALAVYGARKNKKDSA